MKKIVIIIIFFLLLPFTRAYAQEADSAILGTQTVDYALAYPGILPDNPLYFFKTIRDKIVGFLIADPVKKAEFDLLQADKRLESGYLLSLKRPMQEDLIADVISKGENYFSESIDQATFAKKQGNDVTEIVGKLATSNKKHAEVIGQIIQTVPVSLQKKLTVEQERVTKFGTLVNALKASN